MGKVFPPEAGHIISEDFKVYWNPDPGFPFAHRENAIFNLKAKANFGWEFSYWQLATRLGPNAYDTGTKETNPIDVSLIRQFSDSIKATIVQVYAVFKRLGGEPVPVPKPIQEPTPEPNPNPCDDCKVTKIDALNALNNVKDYINNS